MYCTYLTVYKGNRLPPFYIGYSTVKKIHEGYHGSVSSKKYQNIWLEEIKANPHLFVTKIVSIHSTRKEAAEKEAFFQRKMNVLHNSLYVNRTIAGLIIFEGPHSTETKEKMSKIRKGLKPRLGIKHTQETKIKLRESHLGLRYPNRKKHKLTQDHKNRLSLAAKKYWNNVENRSRPKLSEEHKQKISKSMKRYRAIKEI